MQYRENPGNKDQLSILGYGCLRYSKKGTTIDQEKAEREMAAAVEAGVNYFDTAYTYGGSEACLGKFLAKGYRDKVKIATKLPHYYIKAEGDMERYFKEQLERVREIRLSERRFYQKITDIYATSIDYDAHSLTTKKFFARVQNQLHWAIHGETAAETIYRRADSEKENMGLTTWKDAPDGKIQRFDVVIAKNYLTKEELSSMARIVNAYLDLAELRAEEEVPMTMEDWAEQFEGILRLSKKEILTNAGSISAKIAEEHALTEFEKYRVKQDKLYQSDFDKILIGEVDGNEVDYIDDNVNNNEEL